MISDLQILPTVLLDEYRLTFGPEKKQLFDNLHESEASVPNFSFYTSVSAVYSSKIEGEDIDLDSFIKHRKFGIQYQPDYTRKIDDLYNAYLFAQENRLTSETLRQAHAILTKHILRVQQQGKVRHGNMYVLTKDGRIEYVAADAQIAESELEKLFGDIKVLVDSELDFEESFFFAAMIHLVFVKIHPFDDGNGRTARLLEKWFLAEKLGTQSWFIRSEENYYRNHATYYKNLRALGLEYDHLEYNAALPFLQMLPNALTC